jgi:hypothetical protein
MRPPLRTLIAMIPQIAASAPAVICSAKATGKRAWASGIKNEFIFFPRSIATGCG